MDHTKFVEGAHQCFVLPWQLVCPLKKRGPTSDYAHVNHAIVSLINIYAHGMSPLINLKRGHTSDYLDNNLDQS